MMNRRIQFSSVTILILFYVFGLYASSAEEKKKVDTYPRQCLVSEIFLDKIRFLVTNQRTILRGGITNSSHPFDLEYFNYKLSYKDIRPSAPLPGGPFLNVFEGHNKRPSELTILFKRFITDPDLLHDPFEMVEEGAEVGRSSAINESIKLADG